MRNVLILLCLECNNVVLVSHHLREPVNYEIIGLLLIQTKLCKRVLKKLRSILSLYAEPFAQIRLDIDITFPKQVGILPAFLISKRSVRICGYRPAVSRVVIGICYRQFSVKLEFDANFSPGLGIQVDNGRTGLTQITGMSKSEVIFTPSSRFHLKESLRFFITRILLNNVFQRILFPT